jgi:hypothetical protein
MRCRFDLSILLKTLSFAQGPELVVGEECHMSKANEVRKRVQPCTTSGSVNVHRAMSRLSVISCRLSVSDLAPSGRGSSCSLRPMKCHFENVGTASSSLARALRILS